MGRDIHNWGRIGRFAFIAFFGWLLIASVLRLWEDDAISRRNDPLVQKHEAILGELVNRENERQKMQHSGAAAPTPMKEGSKGE